MTSLSPLPHSRPFKLNLKQQVITELFRQQNARHNLIFGGARSGKTLLFVRAMCIRALASVQSRHAILRLRTLHVRQSIWMDTLPKVLRLCWPGYRPIPHEQDGFMQFPNKTVPKEDYSELWIAGLDDKERVEKVLGKEFATLYFNECSQIPYSSILMALTRLAQRVPNLTNRAYYDLNPTTVGHWTNKLFVQHLEASSRERKPLPDPLNYVYAFLNPNDNAENVDPAYLLSLQNMPARTRKRFYDGEYSSEQDGQLWSYDSIESGRKEAVDPSALERLGVRRIVVAIDPSGASGESDVRADEIGLVVVGIDSKDRGLVLEDSSGLYSPEQWGRLACALFHKWSADRVIGEKNFGGDMVRAVVHGADPDVPYRHVVASRGKWVRAEPISALYERGRISHCGSYPVLEDELLNFTTLGYLGAGSPNHADALVWGFTELFEQEMRNGLAEFLQQTQSGISSGELVMKDGMPTDKSSLLAKIASSTLLKPTTGDDTSVCPQCGSKALVKIGRQIKCNQCGVMLGNAQTAASAPNRSGLFK